MPQLRATIIVRPQKAELLCNLLLERELLSCLTVAETIGIGGGGAVPRAQIVGVLNHERSDELNELVSAHGRSTLSGDGVILLQPITSALNFFDT
jgi:nitrogen regulatory protein PII